MNDPGGWNFFGRISGCAGCSKAAEHIGNFFYGLQGALPNLKWSKYVSAGIGIAALFKIPFAIADISREIRDSGNIGDAWHVIESSLIMADKGRSFYRTLWKTGFLHLHVNYPVRGRPLGRKVVHRNGPSIPCLTGK